MTKPEQPSADTGISEDSVAAMIDAGDLAEVMSDDEMITAAVSETALSVTTHSGATDDAAAMPDKETQVAPGKETLLAQMGGPLGMLDSGLPVVVFVIVNVIAGLTAGIIAALSAGVLIAAIRLARHKPVTQAIGGLFAVGIAAYIAHRTGEGRGFFLFGIWTYLLYGGSLLISVIVRWPLIGLAWEGLNGRGAAWRANRGLRRRYDAATLVWVGVFALRYVVMQWLYNRDEVGWLAVAKLAMGYPLFILAIIATVAIIGTSSGIRLRDLVHKRG